MIPAREWIELSMLDVPTLSTMVQELEAAETGADRLRVLRRLRSEVDAVTRAEARRQVDAGGSWADAALAYGVSRQSMWQTYRRR